MKNYLILKRKRLIALLLAIILTFTPIFYQLPNLFGIQFPWFVDAGNIKVASSSGNLLDGVPFDFYGHGGRTGIWIWKTSDGYPAYCLQPTKAMQSGAGMTLDRYSLKDWPSNELDLVQKELIFYAMAAAGQSSANKSVSTAEYIMVQSAIWAIVSGQWTTAADFKANMSAITSHIRSNQAVVTAQVNTLVERFVTTINAFSGNENEYIPIFAAKYEDAAPTYEIKEITTGSGIYQMAFPVNEVCKSFKYQIDGQDLPYQGWDYQYRGDEVIFTYNSHLGNNPNPLIKGVPIAGSVLSTLISVGTVGILLPDLASNQEMILQVEDGEGWFCYTKIITKEVPSFEGSYDVEAYRYKHEETFKTNYKIELMKADAETGHYLADTTFSILEMFDFSQLENSNLNPLQFHQEPSVLTEHVTATTDEQGYLSHSDVKSYNYNKTYCYGHPQPTIEYIPLIDFESEDENEQAVMDALNADIVERNSRLEKDAWAAWEFEINSCTNEVDFHFIEIGEAEKKMKADRDSIWETFIKLEYIYTVEEVQARNGYILNGYHLNDEPIPVISVASSQAGGSGKVIGTYYQGEYTPDFEKVFTKNFEIADIDIDFRQTGWDGVYQTSLVNKLDQNHYDKTGVGFVFEIINHRTEGEVHFNKRDLHLYQENETDSYGKVQGDGTLEGAVYGLYAAEDIVHPDGKTGIVFKAGELVSIATTDKNGDASFLIITENTETSDQLVNLYAGNNLLGRNYPDYLELNGGVWIGRPLLLGSYYIAEIARSEGYELSQYGIELSESNRKGNETALIESGSTSIKTPLAHRINDWDGSWNDFEVRYYGTKNGFDVYLTGYPSGSSFYQVETVYADTIYEVIIDEYQQIVMDNQGNVLYQLAEGGEYKYDENGNRLLAIDDEGNPVDDLTQPRSEVITVTNRLNYYPDRELATSNNAVYQEAVDPDFILSELSELLIQLKYKIPDREAPVKRLSFIGQELTNGTFVEAVLSELLTDDFWDGYGILDVYQDDIETDKWHVMVSYNYSALNDIVNFYDEINNRVILKREVSYLPTAPLNNGYCYIIFEADEFIKSGSRVLLDGFEVAETMYGELYQTINTYEPLYQRYELGEVLLDCEGRAIPVTETIVVYGNETVTEEREVLTRLTNVKYDFVTGTYQLHIENTVDWGNVSAALSMKIRAMAPERTFEGLAYADYILRNGGAVSVFSVKKELEAGSYIRYIDLHYSGALQTYQDGGTREQRIIVLQRIIKQAVRVMKEISLSSYDRVNTYRIHKDPYTMLYGGYGGLLPAKILSGFHFRIYLVSDLVQTGNLTKNSDGSWDYQTFFASEADYQGLAISWDKPEHDEDGDLTTLHANIYGNHHYYGDSVPLPYGTYVIIEQQPTTIPLKHYQTDAPKEIVIPYVPYVDKNGVIYEDIPHREYLYDGEMSAADMTKRYGIRFHEENHVIQVLNKDLELDYEVYKYGLSKSYLPAPASFDYQLSHAEHAGIRDNVYYQTYIDKVGNIVDYGVTLDNVKTMTGKSTAVDRLYAHALVPWSVLPPIYGGIINDDGDYGNRDTGLDVQGFFNFVAFVKSGFENQFFKSWLRIEKIDSETGENILHHGAKFKVYAAKRDVSGNESGTGVIGSGNVLFDEQGLPVYDETDLITLHDETGAEVGIFEAFSTEIEVITENGIEKQVVGYLELPQPLGAGAYVLVEIEAPAGYLKSKPIAFEIYSDEVTYYYDGNPTDRRTAVQYSYEIPLTNSEKLVSQIIVEDKPSKIAIHKVESGTNTITFKVFGTKALLEARGDVEHLQYDYINQTWWGIVTKEYDKWSENIIYGTETELKEIDNIKLIYDEDGHYQGYGVSFDIYVSNAELTLYQGLEVVPLADGYEEVYVSRNKNGKVTEIIAMKTGTHQEIQKVRKDGSTAQNDVWDAMEVKNPPIHLLFYDLDIVPNEVDADSGRLYILDDNGNRTVMADSETGMAYVIDDSGRIITYPLNETGEKITSQSIKIFLDVEGKPYLYNGVEIINDENNLPKYYLNGEVTLQNDIWLTGLLKHFIERLPFGAYILEETKVPFEQGYLQAPPLGLSVQETDEQQQFFLENDFTKTEYAKVDIQTQQEIPDAQMALFLATKVLDESERGFHLEYVLNEEGEKQSVRSWISGYLYDSAGNFMFDENGDKISSTKPYWIDHLPVGCYILEEVAVPYQWGYVQASPLEIIVTETNTVQTFVMEDDYTAIEIIKKDANKDELLVDVKLGFYKAQLDESGQPIRDEEGQLVATERLFGWQTIDGREVATTAYPKLDSDTGEQLFDEAGVPVIAYTYDIQAIPTTLRGCYYLTETGALRMEYLPIGYYILIEEETPSGFATAAPILVEVKDIGSRVEVQFSQMDDQPLMVELYKINVHEDGSKGKVISGAVLSVYETNEFGIFEKVQARDEEGNSLYETDANGEWLLNEHGEPIPIMIYDSAKLRYQFEAGKDGTYQQGEEIPEGFNVGDLKPHQIRYIPQGHYALIETKTPYGFLTANPVFFTVEDTEEIQVIEMEDAIPRGMLEIEKSDIDDLTVLIEGAVFELRNETLGTYLETLVTDKDGKAQSEKYPIGYVDDTGIFRPYIYLIKEIKAPEGYMLNPRPHRFQFIYIDGEAELIDYHYDAVNQQNQVLISKQLLTGHEEMVGVKLRLMYLDETTEVIVTEWITTGHPQIISGLKAGNYRLEELEAPGAGFALAEPIEFVVEDGLINIPEITMYDEHTITEIEKLANDTGKPLAGALLQLTADIDGSVIDRWVTTNEHYVLYGLISGNYTLTELEAPKGYQIAKPITFTVTGDYDVVTVTMIDYLKSTGGGGGNTPNPYIQKLDKDTKAGLSNAWIVIYNPDGSVYAKGQADGQGRFYFKTPSAGTYTFQELVAPEGYFLNENIFTFSVDAFGTVNGDSVIEDVKQPEIPIDKVDGIDGHAISGAMIEFYNSEGLAVFCGKTDDEGRIIFVPTKTGMYHYKEIAAPKGYQLSQNLYTLMVHEDGSFLGDSVIKNYPLAGTITAAYNKLSQQEHLEQVPRTGDTDLRVIFVLLTLLLSVIAIIIFSTKGKDKMKWILCLIVSGASLMIPFKSHLYIEKEYTSIHSETTRKELIKDEEFVEIFLEPTDRLLDISEIEPFYVADGDTYFFKEMDYQIAMEPNQIIVQEEMVEYFAVEFLTDIPQSVSRTVTENPEETITLALEHQTTMNHRWINDFSFDITFEMYESSYYLLGEIYIPYNNETPALVGYEHELLGLIGVNEEHYRILGFEWVGDSYLKDDVMYRDGRAWGERFVVDCQAFYRGTMKLPDKEVYTSRIVYSKLKSADILVLDEKNEEVMIKTNEIMKNDEVFPIDEAVEQELFIEDQHNLAIAAVNIPMMIVIFFAIVMIRWFYKYQKIEKTSKQMLYDSFIE